MMMMMMNKMQKQKDEKEKNNCAVALKADTTMSANKVLLTAEQRTELQIEEEEKEAEEATEKDEPDERLS